MRDCYRGPSQHIGTTSRRAGNTWANLSPAPRLTVMHVSLKPHRRENALYKKCRSVKANELKCRYRVIQNLYHHLSSLEAPRGSGLEINVSQPTGQHGSWHVASCVPAMGLRKSLANYARCVSEAARTTVPASLHGRKHCSSARNAHAKWWALQREGPCRLPHRSNFTDVPAVGRKCVGA